MIVGTASGVAGRAAATWKEWTVRLDECYWVGSIESCWFPPILSLVCLRTVHYPFPLDALSADAESLRTWLRGRKDDSLGSREGCASEIMKRSIRISLPRLSFETNGHLPRKPGLWCSHSVLVLERQAAA